MAFVTRLTRLFRADLNAVIERLEEPEMLLRLAIEEMDEALADDRRALKTSDRDCRQAAGRLQRFATDLTALTNELDLCFSTGKEELARNLIRRKLELEQAERQWREKAEAMAAGAEQLHKRIEDNTFRLESMRQKLDLLDGMNGTAAAPHAHDDPGFEGVRVRDADIDIAFLKEKQKRSAA